METKPIIPKDVDPIELADEIKKGLTSNWINRKLKAKSHQGQLS